MGLILLATALASRNPVTSKCQVTQIVALPVTMVGRRPTVSVQFGSKNARFIVDSGAFYSTISRASAAEFGLKVEPAPLNFRLKGVGGETSAGIATSADFSLAGNKLPKIEFLVGGSDTGDAGLLGQNILGLADVEYDLPHGTVRLMKPARCANANLAYWAQGKITSSLALEGPLDGLFKPHTIGTVFLNGVKVRAVFDSGAETSLLTLAAAKRAGVTPESPGVVAGGLARGLGTHQVQSWLASFDKIDIGGELINHPKIRVAQVEIGGPDMLIGADFFLTHRLFVSNANRVLYLTYEGGPLFGLSPKGARTSDGTAINLTDTTAPPKTAEDFSRRGAVFASNHRLEEALTDFSKAISLAPAEGRYFYQRGAAHLEKFEHAEALADMDRAIGLDPNDVDARLTRAGMRLGTGNLVAATVDIKAADAILAPSSDRRLILANLYDEVGAPEAALTNYDMWLKSHLEDGGRAAALNGRCWVRGLLNRDLDKALADCGAALRAQPHNAAFLDSRALVRLRRGELAQALADYDAAIQISPRSAWSIYGRSLVHMKLGNVELAKTDREMALGIDVKVRDRAKMIGLEQ